MSIFLFTVHYQEAHRLLHKLPRRLKNSMKDLTNIKNNDNKCFLWCHIRHLNPPKIHPDRMTKANKSMANDLDYEGIYFPVSKKDFSKIGKKNNVCINVFCYENNLVCPVYVPNEKFENYMDLLTKKSHIRSISKILTDLCVIRQNARLKNTFASIVYNVLVVREF